MAKSDNASEKNPSAHTHPPIYAYKRSIISICWNLTEISITLTDQRRALPLYCTIAQTALALPQGLPVKQGISEGLLKIKEVGFTLLSQTNNCQCQGYSPSLIQHNRLSIIRQKKYFMGGLIMYVWVLEFKSHNCYCLRLFLRDYSSETSQQMTN